MSFKKYTHIEATIAADLDPDVVQKIYVHLKFIEQGWKPQFIPRLLETVWHYFILEEIYQICKKYRNPTINFMMLKKYIYNQVKVILPEVFE